MRSFELYSISWLGAEGFVSDLAFFFAFIDDGNSNILGWPYQVACAVSLLCIFLLFIAAYIIHY